MDDLVGATMPDGYKAAEGVALLEKQVEELLLLTRQQAIALASTQQESAHKSQRILELQRAVGKAAVSADSAHVLRPRMRLSAEVAAAGKNGPATSIPSQKLHPVEAARTAERRIVQLGEERDYWRRHFDLAERRAAALAQQLQEAKVDGAATTAKTAPLPPLKPMDLNASDAESLFVKNLLKENLELKQKLDVLTTNGGVSGKKSVTIREAEKDLDVSPTTGSRYQGKENHHLHTNRVPDMSSQFNVRPTPATGRPPVRMPPPPRQPGAVSSGRFFPRPTPTMSRPAAVVPRVASLPRHFHTTDCCGGRECGCPACSGSRTRGLESQVHQLTQQNTSLISQVNDLKLELERKAQQIACCHCLGGGKAVRSGPVPGVSGLGHGTSGPGQGTSGPPGRTGGSSSSGRVGRSANSTAPCPECQDHVCKNGSRVRFEDSLDADSVHLCENIQCLQRQVCHLKLQLGRQVETAQRVSQLETEARQSSQEVGRLSEKCDSLLEQKRDLLEQISAQKRQLDLMLEKGDTNARVRTLLQDIESQRDRYKAHVSSLIRELQGKEVRVLHHAHQEEPASADSSEKRGEETAAVSDLRSQLAAHQAEVLQLRQDAARLRKELMDALAQPRHAHTQTTPRQQAEQQELLNSLQADLNNLKAAKQAEQLRQPAVPIPTAAAETQTAATAVASRPKSKPSLRAVESVIEEEVEDIAGSDVDGVAASRAEQQNGSREEIRQLRDKVRYLERQLDTTENALRTNQNLVSENSARTYELNSQLVQLKMTLNETSRTVDEQRLKLDKKEELIRKIIEDKEELFDRLNKQKERTSSLESELAVFKEKVRRLEEERSGLQERLDTASTDLRQRERRTGEREEEAGRLRSELERAEDSLRNIRMDNSTLRQEMEFLKREVETRDRENKSQAAELQQLRLELQRYINEVRRVEDVLETREEDRRRLHRQYEELSREIQETETANRSLEMQAANLMIEVRGKESDLEAAKARCDSMEKYLEEIQRQNETFRTQVVTLNAKVDMLTADLQENRITRDTVLTDLDSVNELAVKLNTDKVELLSRIGQQNHEVEKLQEDLVKLREELLGAMAELEAERHRARTLQHMVTSSHVAETRESVIRQVEKEIIERSSGSSGSDKY